MDGFFELAILKIEGSFEPRFIILNGIVEYANLSLYLSGERVQNLFRLLLGRCERTIDICNA